MSTALKDFSMPEDIFDELEAMLPQGRNSSERQPLFAEFLRPITEADLLAAETAKPVRTSKPTLQKLRSSHHEAARLVALGKNNPEIALITGYNPDTIKKLRVDPAFQELIAYYRGMVEEVYIDTHKKLAGFTNDALDVLHERVRETPEAVKTEELIKALTIGLDRTGFGPKSTINSNVVVTHVELERLKAEAAARSQGTVRQLQADSGPPVRQIDLTAEAVPASPAAPGSEGSGAELRKEVPSDASAEPTAGRGPTPLSVD